MEKKPTKQESLRRWNRAERDKRDDCDCKRGGEPRGCFFSSAAHTGTETSPPMENTAPTRTYVWDQDIRTEGGRKTREGGKREKRRGATNMLQDVAPEQKTPKREKKKKKKPLHFPCLCSAGASSRLAGWRRRRRFDRSIQQNTGETLNTGHVVSERLIGCRDDCGAGNPPPTPSCLHAMPPLG